MDEALRRGKVGVDGTDQRLIELETADLAERLALALEAGGFGTWRWEKATGVVEWDTKLEELYGLQPGGFDGTFDAYVALLHPEDVAATLATVAEAVEAKSSYVVEHRVVWPDGSVRWLQGKGRVTLDEAGEVTGTIGCTADVTDQMMLVFEQDRSHAVAVAAAELERVSRERLQFLGEINDALARSYDEQALMQNVTHATVPRLGDWCAIAVLPESGNASPEVAFAHADAEMAERAKELLERVPYDPDAAAGIPAVIRSGASEFTPQIDEPTDDEATGDASDLIRELGLSSVLVVPLTKRGRVLGAMQVANSASSRAYTADDLALAEAVAVRIASTVTNIRLTERHRTIATTLQASLLPASLPVIPGLEAAVRYWAAGEGTQVGGDFYDLFELDTGWAVVIGDVCGTGPEAASLTGLVRHTIRALAWQNASPDEVLLQVNKAVMNSDRRTFCTAVFATLTKTSSGFRFEMASAGHPLPIVHRASTGHTETVGGPGTLLGAFDEPRSLVVSTDLAPGDAIVLYTDGITDVRPPHGLSTEELLVIVERAAADAASAADVVQRLGSEVSAILPISKRNDDIAILALKVSTERAADDDEEPAHD
jgi:serine phosphatase RsbU (regulator of sigma subunit)